MPDLMRTASASHQICSNILSRSDNMLLQADMSRLQNILRNACKTAEPLSSFTDGDPMICRHLDDALYKLELAVVEARGMADRHRPRDDAASFSKPAPPWQQVCGAIEVTDCGWLHITLDTLLPHCRFSTPIYLTDTLTRLMDDYERRGGQLPFYQRPFLAIDEHTPVTNRQVYDSDNKGWRAVSNTLKGRIFEDDDQFTLSLGLLSRLTNYTACHIHVMEICDADLYFNMRYNDE